MKLKLLFLIAAGLIASCDSSSPTNNSSDDPLNDPPATDPPVSTVDFTIERENSKPVSPFFFGQNYWSWVDEWGAQVQGTEELVADIQLNMLRIGGTEADRSYPHPFDYDKVKEAIAYARAVGAEPVLQLPGLYDMSGEPATTETAMEMVNYVRDHNLGVKYFSIGNEPDIYTDQGVKTSYTPQELSIFFNAVSDSIKKIDPDYVILGPDLAWKYYENNNWLSPFLSQSAQKLDVVSIHRYPFDPDAATKENVMKDAEKFRSDIRMIKDYLSQVSHSEVPIAVTETHVSYDGDPMNSNFSASPQTFWAGLWVADVVGVALEEEVWNLSFWSISEGWTLGFIDGETKEPRPTYQVLKLLANHVGDRVLTVSGTETDVSVYATENTDENAVIVWFLNKSNQEKEISWKVKESSLEQDYDINLVPNSLTLLIRTTDGNMDQWIYSEEQSDKNSEPVFN